MSIITLAERPEDWLNMRQLWSGPQPCTACGEPCAVPLNPMPVPRSNSIEHRRRVHVGEVYRWGTALRGRSRHDLDRDHEAVLEPSPLDPATGDERDTSIDRR